MHISGLGAASAASLKINIARTQHQNPAPASRGEEGPGDATGAADTDDSGGSKGGNINVTA